MNFLKEKWEYVVAKVKTPAGRFDIFVGAFLAGFIIVNYTKLIFGFLENLFSFLQYKWMITYFSYLVYGLLWIPLGYGISWVNTKIYKTLEKYKRKYI